MANITINGEVVATLTENVKDIGNSEYLKILIGGKSYYARLATDMSKLFVYKENKKQYVQKDAIFFETFRYERKFENFEQRFNLWLPKGEYSISLGASTTISKTITIAEGEDVGIVFQCAIYKKTGNGNNYLTIMDGSGTLCYIHNYNNRSNAWFTISRQGD